MRTALTHCCRHCKWQQTMVPHDGGSTTKECFDHCPWCRSLELLERRATRLEALAASFARPSYAAYRRNGKLPRKGLDSPYKWRQQSAPISIQQESNDVRS